MSIKIKKLLIMKTCSCILPDSKLDLNNKLKEKFFYILIEKMD